MIKITTFSSHDKRVYTTSMKVFVSSTEAPIPKTETVRVTSLGLAAVITVMMVGQLFSFEEFSPALATLQLPGDEPMAFILAASLCIFELLSLPFLLSMRLSPAFRVLSMACGWFVAAKWLFITTWETAVAGASHSVLFGTSVPLPAGWWNVFFVLVLGSLIVWISWSLWPFRVTKSTI